MNINILAVGKVLNSPYTSISDHYIKNIQSISKRSGITNFTINEIEKSKEKDAELRKLREFNLLTKKLDPQKSINVLLDERGKLISSTKLKSMLYEYQLSFLLFHVISKIITIIIFLYCRQGFLFS